MSMVDAFLVSGEVLAEAFGTSFPSGPILVTVPSGTLSFEDYLELAILKEAYVELHQEFGFIPPKAQWRN